MSDPAGIPALIAAIRDRHDCGAKHVLTIHVHEKTPDGRRTVWDGDVEMFELTDHPTAKLAYAWSDATTRTTRRFFAVLHMPPVDSPMTAVRASVLPDAVR